MLVPDEKLWNKIYLIRGQKVMLDKDLAELYGVETRVLNQAVSRNMERFPEDFMFQLTNQEWDVLKSQNVISSWGGRRKLPFVFSELGVAMLSGVLSSARAIQVNIRIMRLFTKMREMMLTHKDLLLEMEEIRKRMTSQDERIEMVFDYLTQFITKNETEADRRKIGFKTKTGDK